MITLALLVQNDAAEMPAALAALRGVTADGTALVIIDQGSQDTTAALARGFLAKEGAGDLVVLDKTLSKPDATALALKTGKTDFALVLTVHDRLRLKPFAQLQETLKAGTTPEKIVLRAGWWASSVQSYIPVLGAPEEGLASLVPDPGLVLQKRGKAPAKPSDAAQTWAEFYSALTPPAETVISAECTVLRPLALASGRGAFAKAQALVAAAPEALGLALQWASAALALCPAGEADNVLREAEDFVAACTEKQRAELQGCETLAGRLLAACLAKDKSEALSRLALCAAMRQDAVLAALQADYASLRADLTAALPGPEYLLALHRELLAR